MEQNVADLAEQNIVENGESQIHQSDKKSFSKPLLILFFSFIVFTCIAFIALSYTSNNLNNKPSTKEDFQNTPTTILENSLEEAQNLSGVVDTNQNFCFDDNSVITCGTSYQGQDAQYLGTQPRYTDNEDGTVSDVNTGLMWIKKAGEKQSYSQAIKNSENIEFAGYDDWRVPSIKELYSLMDFSGIDPDSSSQSSEGLVPFIDTNYFDFAYGDISNGDRIIDSQWITSSLYTSTVMNNQECFFGVNFADGRIKCYPTNNQRNNGYYVRLVRGSEYGRNQFVDNNDQTITDVSSGLMWQKNDSQKGMDWKSSLHYCEDLELAQFTDWRLPNAKELQYIVDYTRSPDKSNSPAIDPIFYTSSVTNEMGQVDYPYFWTGTTQIGSRSSQNMAVYISFGRAIGQMNGQWMDVHGAGAQRSDPKSGDIHEYPQSFGPQGDARRLHNYVRCVRSGDIRISNGESAQNLPALQLENESDRAGLKPEQPPEEAISACVGKASEASCSFSTPRGIVSGVCQKTPDTFFACLPI